MNNHSAHKLRVAASPDYAVQWFSYVALYVALGIISVYRAILSPVLLSISGPACRFEPTCSAYAAEAISQYGITRGGWMALKRLLKCRPLGGWGFDPLPTTRYRNHVETQVHRGLSR